MFTRESLAASRVAADRARAQIRARAKEPERPVAPGVAALETAGMACALGIVDGARGGSDDGVTSLLVGTLLHAFALAGDGEDRLAQHAQALGNGALAASAYRAGFGATRETRSNARPARHDREAEAPTARGGARRVEVTVARVSVARVSIASWP